MTRGLGIGERNYLPRKCFTNYDMCEAECGANKVYCKTYNMQMDKEGLEDLAIELMEERE